jgi:translation initiation factor SUI1
MSEKKNSLCAERGYHVLVLMKEKPATYRSDEFECDECNTSHYFATTPPFHHCTTCNIFDLCHMCRPPSTSSPIWPLKKPSPSSSSSTHSESTFLASPSKTSEKDQLKTTSVLSQMVFANTNFGSDEVGIEIGGRSDEKSESKVHLRLQQRAGKKSLTIVEGLKSKTLNETLSALKKSLATGGSLQDGLVMVLNGDVREQVKQWLIAHQLATKENIVTHGPSWASK